MESFILGWVLFALAILYLIGLAFLSLKTYDSPMACCVGCVALVVVILIVSIFVGGFCSHAAWHVIHDTHAVSNISCISRENCPSYAVCYNMSFEIGLSLDDYGDPPKIESSGAGHCRSCRSFQPQECFPPCYMDGTDCVVDLFAFDMKLDQKIPYFMNTISAIAKPALSLLVFTPRKMNFDNVWGYLQTNALRACFIALAVNAFLLDIQHQWTILSDSHMCWWMKMWALATTLSTSSNLTAAAAMASMFISRIIKEDPFDVPDLFRNYGILFAIYWVFLGILYVPAIIGLTVLAIPGMLAYCWLVLLYTIIAALVGKLVSFVVTKHLKKMIIVARQIDKNDDALLLNIERLLDTELKEFPKTPREYIFHLIFHMSEYTLYFLLPLVLPLLSFIIPMSSRLFNGYGYKQALWMTSYERHSASLLNSIRLDTQTVFDFFWNIF